MALEGCPDDFAGPSMSASYMTEVEAREAMTARTTAAAARMSELPPRVCARQSRLLGDLLLAYHDVSHQAPSNAAALQRFEMLLRGYDSELESMLMSLSLVIAALAATSAAIGAGDVTSGAWAAAGDAVKEVVKRRRTMQHTFVECTEQMAELRRLYSRRPRAPDIL